MQRTASMGLLVVGILGLGFALGVVSGPWFRGLTPSTTHSSSPEPSAELPVSALGKLQPAGGIISVFGPPGDRVEKVKIHQGEKVTRKQPLLVLASAADRKKEAALAETHLKEARMQLAAIERSRTLRLAEIQQQIDGLESSHKIEVESEKLKVAVLRRQYEAAEAQQRRMASLDPTIVRVSAQERDQADLAVNQARSEFRGAETAQSASKQKYELAMKSARAQKKSAEAEYDLAHDRVPIESLKQSVTLAKLRVDRSTLKSPVDGTVLRVLTREGDAIGVEPAVQLASGTRMAVVAEVYARDVERLAAWLKDNKTIEAKVTSPPLGKAFVVKGEVNGEQAIAHVVARNSVPNFGSRGDSDRRVIDVRIELDESATPLASRFVGMEVNVELKPK